MGKERASNHHQTAKEVLEQYGLTIEAIKIDANAFRRFREDRVEDGDRETQLRNRFGNALEIDPGSIQFLGKKKTEKLHGFTFRDPKDACVYFVRRHKQGFSLANVFHPEEGKRGTKYSY